MADRDVEFCIHMDALPKKTKTGYKVSIARDGKLYPPMSMRGTATSMSVWLDAEVVPIKHNADGTPALSKTGSMKMDIGGG